MPLVEPEFGLLFGLVLVFLLLLVPLVSVARFVRKRRRLP